VIGDINVLEKINKCWKSFSLMEHNPFSHEHKLKVMNEMFFVWIEKHKRVVERVLYLNGQLVM
jgi:hypothetical protein